MVSDASLLRAFGVAAILGGALRIAAAIIPYSEQPWLELLYLSIDLFLLFGLMGVYFAYRAQVGWFGLLSFAIAEAGIASIVGPNTLVDGFDMYMLSVAIIGFGLTLFAVQLLLRRAGPWWAPACWIASTLAGVGGAVANQTDLGFLVGGVLFGLGFVAAGTALMRPLAS